MGKLIIFEGLDGSGKGTQTKLTAQRLKEQGRELRQITFPDYESESSALVKMYLSGAFGDKPDDVNAYMPEKFLHGDFLLLCNHCENPPCVRVCPTAATFKREDGIVVMDPHRCIGCRFCMAGCPFGARSFNFRDPQPYVKDVNPEFPMRTRGVVEKCTFCTERLAQGKLPACVEASEGAMIFGDLNDPGSPVRQALSENFTIRRKPTLGTQPGVYYII